MCCGDKRKTLKPGQKQKETTETKRSTAPVPRTGPSAAPAGRPLTYVR